MGLTMFLKISLVVVALITMVVGLYAHYTSEWLKASKDHGGGDGLYKTCENWENVKKSQEQLHSFDISQLQLKPSQQSQTQAQAGLNKLKSLDEVPKNCPAISLEQFFVAATIICFLGAIVSVMLGFCWKDSDTKKQSKSSKFVDAGLHVVLALLLFCGAICFIVSAVQAQKIYDYRNSVTKKGRGRSIYGGSDGTGGDPWESPEPVEPYPSEPYPSDPEATKPESSITLPPDWENSLNQLLHNVQIPDNFKGKSEADFKFQMNYELKLAAGAIAFLQAIFHLIVSVTIFLSGKSKDNFPGQNPSQSQAYAGVYSQQQPYGYGYPQQAGQQQTGTNEGPDPAQ